MFESETGFFGATESENDVRGDVIVCALARSYVVAVFRRGRTFLLIGGLAVVVGLIGAACEAAGDCVEEVHGFD